MIPIYVAGVGVMLGVLGIFGMYSEAVIIPSKYYYLMGIALVVTYFITSNSKQRNKNITRTVIFTTSVFFVLGISGFVYHKWTMTFISDSFMLKFTLIVLGILAVYVNLLYFRGEDSYKSKRGNQRIKNEPKRSFLEERKEKRRIKEEEENGIVFTLGTSMDREED